MINGCGLFGISHLFANLGGVVLCNCFREGVIFLSLSTSLFLRLSLSVSLFLCLSNSVSLIPSYVSLSISLTFSSVLLSLCMCLSVCLYHLSINFSIFLSHMITILTADFPHLVETLLRFLVLWSFPELVTDSFIGIAESAIQVSLLRGVNSWAGMQSSCSRSYFNFYLEKQVQD